MDKVRLEINGITLSGDKGQTILQVATENHIWIPTFCFDERVGVYGGCGICVVEVEGNPKLVRACATEISEGMKVKTDSPRVIESRKTNLELLFTDHLGDCVAPCAKACPAGTDCQGYVKLIKDGNIEGARELIMEKIPLPSSIGRICPHPCEERCRRGLIEEPINIAALKRFAGDKGKEGWDNSAMLRAKVGPATGKSVVIVGGGPFGISAAYFLRKMGHEVSLFEAMPRLGGMLRYGIPEYRLPKDVLEDEIEDIIAMGVKVKTGVKIGEDMDFETLCEDYDAVILGIGAWLSTGIGCPGEDATGVMGGIEFLGKVAKKSDSALGENVAVVGGGKTAMDAARTALRLGAKKVYNIYRRTFDEMPATKQEIEEAVEEGVIFKNLVNPVEILKDSEGAVCGMVLQQMELGEPDKSGRRRPVAIDGKTEILDVDSVILAIGQRVDSSPFSPGKTKNGGICYDVDTYMTDISGVFAGGDCGNDKISIAVEAMADGKKAAESVDAYLKGEKVEFGKPYLSVRNDISEKTFEDRERMFREKAEELDARIRRENFEEVVFSGLTKEQAASEASRCLECGCHAYGECKLAECAAIYDVKPERFAGEFSSKGRNETENSPEKKNPFIIRDMGKCISCGLCVRICDEVVGAGILGSIGRGFDTVIKETPTQGFSHEICGCCVECVKACPVGALRF